jgi:hypothetical protein
MNRHFLGVCILTLVGGCGPDQSGFSEGNILISDQWNNRVIEIDRNGNIVWTFGDGAALAGPTSIVGPNDAERLPNGDTLIAATGLPSGTIPACTGSDGCPDSRVLIVNAAKMIVWQYGQAGVTGSDLNQLNAPVSARMLANDNVLITDQGNCQVIEVTMANPPTVTPIFGTTGVCGQNGPGQLNNPNSAERLANGNTLIADESSSSNPVSRVLEISPSGAVVWQYPMSPDPSLLASAAFASRLANGNTLITDGGANQVIEIASDLTVVWSYATNARPGSNPNPQPSHAVRLRDGNTLIADQLNEQVIEVSNNKAVVASFGKINTAGDSSTLLNWPYDAKVLGDFTGLSTPPAN